MKLLVSVYQSVYYCGFPGAGSTCYYFYTGRGKKTEALRPPVVWNYPIERIDTTPHQVTLIKKEIQKNEIRKTNPFACYHDQRIEKFLELCNKMP